MFVLVTEIARNTQTTKQAKELGQFRSDVIKTLSKQGFNRDEIQDLFEGFPVEVSKRRTYSLLKIKEVINH